MNKIIFSLVFSLAFSLSINAATEWLGGNGNWQDASNWNTGQVPGIGDDVLISSGVVELNSNATVRSLDLGAGANLIIKPYARLTVLPTAATFYPVVVYGKLNIEGTLQVLDQLGGVTTSHYITLYGYLQVENSGTVELDGRAIVVYSAGVYNNRGLTRIENVSWTGLNVFGVFLNSKTLEIEGEEADFGVRVFSNGQFVNHKNVYINDVARGIENENRVYNTGAILLTNCGSGIFNFGSLDNRYSGLIKTEDTEVSFDIYNATGATINNRGRIQTDNSDAATGVRNYGSVTNYSTGRIYLDGGFSYSLLLNEEDADFLNYGRINLYATANSNQDGLRNNGDFTNYSSGRITIQGNYPTSFQNDENFTNQGYLSVTNSQQRALFNKGVLQNASCGEMIIAGSAENNSNSVWLNDSWLRLTTDDRFANNGFFQNTAIIEDTYDVLAGVSIFNDGVVAHLLNGPLSMGANSSILDVGSLSQVDISRYFYNNPNGDRIGEYNAGNNTLYLYSNADGLETIYFSAELLGYNCTTWFAINILGGIQYAPGPFASLFAGNAPTTTRANVYPNPSNGLIQVNWPGATIEEEARWSVISLQGQEVATGTTAVGNIDLRHLPAATYLLRIQDGAGQWQVAERIIIQ
jgi:hypothetical protein